MKLITNSMFTGWVKEIIKWNAVSRNGEHDFSEEVIHNQIDYTIEEIKETILGILQNDRRAILDGAGDVLVTLAYLHFLVTAEERGEMEVLAGLQAYFDETDQYEQPKAGDYGFRDMDDLLIAMAIMVVDVKSSLDSLNYARNNNTQNYRGLLPALYDLKCLMNLILTQHEELDVVSGVEEVLRSNWSKFPKASDYANADAVEAECRYIENERGKKNVKATLTEYNGEQYYVFRDANGKGKIAKPSSFSDADLTPYI